MGRNVYTSKEKLRELMVNLGMDASDFLDDLEEVVEASEDAKDSIEGIGKEAEDTEKTVAKSAKGMGSAWDRAKKSLGDLGDVGKFVFGTVLGLGAVQSIRKLIGFFRGVVTAGLEFQQSMFTLEVAIRGLQRVGLDTTIEGWQKRLATLKSEFPIFSKKAFVDAASLAALMTREFGFTEEQIANVVRQSVILAQITGKDLAEAVRGVTYAIGSGYFESLQRAGINISRQIIAEEALKRGYEGSYTALNQNVRAMLTYEIVQNNLNAISEDASRIIETTTGQVQRLNASYEDLIMTLGVIVTSSEEAKDSVGGLASILEWATEILTIYNNLGKEKGIDEIVDYSPAFGQWGMLLQSIQQWLGFAKEAREEWENMHGWIGLIHQKLVDMGVLDPPELLLGDAPIGFGDTEAANQARFDELEEALKEAIEGQAEIIEDGEEKKLDLQEKSWREIEKNWDKHLQRMEDIKVAHDQKLADIGLKESRAVADEEVDYAFKVAEAARQAAFRKEEAERKYREREIQAEKRFLEKMRQLRENFLLNLEDAVRERDALQIIRLTRQYNLRKTQMERENKLSGKDRSDAFQEQLRQIEFQRQERQRQLAIEHQRRLDDIATQAERERARAKLDFDRKQTDEKARAEAENAAREEKHKQAMIDLDTQIQERIDKMIDGLREEYGLSKAELEAIDGLYYDIYLNADSSFNQGITNAIIRLQQLNAMHNLVASILSQKFANVPAGGYLGPPPGQAEGGTIIANKPTTVTFGEAGIEAATFTPLNRPGVNRDRVTGSLPAGMRGRMGGEKHVVGISLTPGLEGKIINQTMDEMSEVLVQIERARI